MIVSNVPVTLHETAFSTLRECVSSAGALRDLVSMAFRYHVPGLARMFYTFRSAGLRPGAGQPGAPRRGGDRRCGLVLFRAGHEISGLGALVHPLNYRSGA